MEVDRLFKRKLQVENTQNLLSYGLWNFMIMKLKRCKNGKQYKNNGIENQSNRKND